MDSTGNESALPPASNTVRDDEFYIGWMGKAPANVSKFLRSYVLLLLSAIAFIGIIITISQKKFSTSNFEYGTLTQVKGIYFDKPVPMLKVIAGKDLFGKLSYITMPLVG